MLRQVRPSAVVLSVEETFYQAGFEACKAQLRAAEKQSSSGRVRFCYGMVVGAAASLAIAFGLNFSNNLNEPTDARPVMAVQPKPTVDREATSQIAPAEMPAIELVKRGSNESDESIPVSTQFLYNGIRTIVAAKGNESKFSKPIRSQELLAGSTGLLIGTFGFNERQGVFPDPGATSDGSDSSGDSLPSKLPSVFLFPSQGKQFTNPSF